MGYTTTRAPESPLAPTLRLADDTHRSRYWRGVFGGRRFCGSGVPSFVNTFNTHTGPWAVGDMRPRKAAAERGDGARPPTTI